MSYEASQTDRLLANLIRYGRVQSVAGGMATVDFDGEVVSGLTWTKQRAGDDRQYHAPSVGEQVVVLSPSGELSQGVIVGSISQDLFPDAGSDANPRTIYADGTVIEYNKTSHTLTIDTSAASGTVLIKCNTATIEAVSSVTIDAPNTTCTGNLSVTKSLTMGEGGGTATIKGNVAISGGTLTHNGKNIGATHQHTGVQTGGGNTGGVL